MNRKAGDWNCWSCQHLNFSRRDTCQRCGESKSVGGDWIKDFGGGHGGSSYVFSGPDVKPGDWHCSCGTHNFASRSSCFKCGGFKDVSSIGGGGWKSGDWVCTRPGCDEHNYASRMECYRCNTPRDYSGT